MREGQTLREGSALANKKLPPLARENIDIPGAAPMTFGAPINGAQ